MDLFNRILKGFLWDLFIEYASVNWHSHGKSTIFLGRYYPISCSKDFLAWLIVPFIRGETFNAISPSPAFMKEWTWHHCILHPGSFPIYINYRWWFQVLMAIYIKTCYVMYDIHGILLLKHQKCLKPPLRLQHQPLGQLLPLCHAQFGHGHGHDHDCEHQSLCYRGTIFFLLVGQVKNTGCCMGHRIVDCTWLHYITQRSRIRSNPHIQLKQQLFLVFLHMFELFHP